MKRLFAYALIGGTIALMHFGCSGGSNEETSEFVPVPEVNQDPASGVSNVSVVGTSNSDEASPAHSGATLPLDAAPEQVVESYLASLKSENYVAAEDLLTQTAKEAFYQAKLQPSLPGSPDSTFKVGSVRFATQKQERGYVETTWTEMTEEGQPVSYAVDIYVRQEIPGIWRVAGMMMDVEEGDIVFFNFEDAADMLNKNDGIEVDAEVRQAQQPGIIR